MGAGVDLTLLVIWLLLLEGTVLLGCLMRHMLRSGSHPFLEQIETFLPLRGRWLRYLLAVLVGLVFVPLFVYTVLMTLLLGAYIVIGDFGR